MATLRFVVITVAVQFITVTGKPVNSTVELPIDELSEMGNKTLQLSEAEANHASKALYKGELELSLTLKAKIGLGVEITHEKKKRGAIKDSELRWKHGVIPYAFSRSLNESIRRMVVKSANHITYKTRGCIKFVPRKSEEDYVLIQRGDNTVCNSMIGCVGGEQTLNLGEGCHYYGTMIHELMHAVGFFHEHQRQDRDEKIKIYWNNVEREHREENFGIEDGNNQGFPYNFESIMQYGPTAFAIDDHYKTMAAKDGRSFTAPYEKLNMHKMDADQIVKFYGDQCNFNFNSKETETETK